MPTVVIYGTGAIGGLAGAYLARAGHQVRLLARPAWAEAVRANGMHVHLPDGTRLDARAGLSAFTDFPSALGPAADLVILSVKSYDTAAALADFEAAGQAMPPVLTLQNGVGNEETLAQGLGADRVLSGMITYPVSHSAPGELRVERLRGGLGVAAVSPRPAADPGQWANLLSAAALPARTFADYRALKWSKLLINLLANASAAILDCSSMDVMADPALFSLEVAALREALAVMRALRVPVVALPGYPVPLLALAIRWAPRPVLQRVLGPMVGGSRGSKPPSLRIDLARKRSEAPWMNGAVARSAAQMGVPAPVNRVLAGTLERLCSDAALQPGRAWRATLLNA